MLPMKLRGLPVATDPWGIQLESPQLKEIPPHPSSFEEGSLRVHNFYRARHGSSELTLSQMLSDSAKKWAEVLSRMKYIHHSSRNIKGVRIGENIAIIFSNKPVICSGEEVTGQWYSEAEKYNFEQGGDTNICGHFSQIVWRSSRQMGIGQATTADGHSIVVAHYYPAGNISGHYSTNVLPPCYPDIIHVINHNKPTVKPHSRECHRNIPLTTDSSNSVIETSARTTLNHSQGSPESGSIDSSCSVIDTSARISLKHNHQAPKILQSSSTDSNGFMIEASFKQDHQAPKILQSSSTDSNSSMIEASFKHNHQSPKILQSSSTDSNGSMIEASLKHNHQSPKILQSSSTDSNGSMIEASLKHNHQSPKILQSSSTDSNGSMIEASLKHNYQSPKILQPVSQTLAVFSKDCLEVHNKYRRQHNSPPLLLSEELSKLAQRWAKTIAQDSYLYYSTQLYKGQRIGQNIMFKWTRQGACLSGSEVSDLWYSQVQNFDFSHCKHRMDTGHFTQLVWKNSQYIGIGKAGNSFGAMAVVAFYYPAGNIAEDIQDNVFGTF